MNTSHQLSWLSNRKSESKSMSSCQFIAVLYVQVAVKKRFRDAGDIIKKHIINQWPQITHPIFLKNVIILIHQVWCVHRNSQDDEVHIETWEPCMQKVDRWQIFRTRSLHLKSAYVVLDYASEIACATLKRRSPLWAFTVTITFLFLKNGSRNGGLNLVSPCYLILN